MWVAVAWMIAAPGLGPIVLQTILLAGLSSLDHAEARGAHPDDTQYLATLDATAAAVIVALWAAWFVGWLDSPGRRKAASPDH